ncbi:hypothetical protein [Anaerocolumna sp.]|uniref:hypothetical protein n=1 Tax=Anaerocolumna sp. TaxID=2041569 RepID=UPI0028AF37AA|nr:hypothetical protein [Anaerocolumna sp.]
MRPFAANRYLLSVSDMKDLGEDIQAYYEGRADIVPWENTDPTTIVNLIGNFIEKNWYKTDI